MSPVASANVAASRSVDEWRELAEHAILDFLNAEKAFVAHELEAKVAEQKWGSFPTINPHHLTYARIRLEQAGAVESFSTTTRGGSFQRVVTLSSPSKTAQRAAGRKRLLAARFHSWTQTTKEFSPSLIGPALERVVHSSLVEAATSGYTLLNPAGGEVRRVLGGSVPGGPLDNGAWFLSLDAGGAPGAVTLVLIEAKNLRQWIYPRTQELYQLLDKAVSLQVAHPNRAMVPVFVCRVSHPTLGSMARQIGFHIITTKNQYIRPVILNDEVNARKLEEVNYELGYRLVANDEAVPPMVKQFRQVLPARLEEAASRWSAFSAHPDVPDLVAAMRDDEISADERVRFKDELGRCAEEVTGEVALWAATEHE